MTKKEFWQALMDSHEREIDREMLVERLRFYFKDETREDMIYNLTSFLSLDELKELTATVKQWWEST